jgi:reverse gyrase
MANTDGWRDVEEFIKNNIKYLESRLFTEDLEKPEFDKIQAKREAYKSVLDFVHRRIESVPLEY